MQPAVSQSEPELQPERDLELWLSVGVETRPLANKSRVAETNLMKKFRGSLEMGYRSNENLGNGKNFYTTLGLRYRLIKWLRTGMDVRYNVRDRYSRNTWRIDLQATASAKAGKFDLRYRLTGQHEFTDVTSYRDIVRNRFQVGYRIKGWPLDPYISAETFTTFHYTGTRLIGMRYDLGTSFGLGKVHTIDLALRHDREVNVPAPLYRTILVVAYELTLDP